MSYKISVDKDTCIGCGSCEALCPKTFEMEEGIAIVKRKKMEELTDEIDAKEICPSESIIIEKS